MIITLTQQPAELAIGATARLRVDLGISAPPMDSAALVGVAAGAWTKISLGSGLSLDGTTLSVLGGGGSGGPLPLASTSLHGVVRIGANISVDGGLISLTKANAEAALGLTPVDAAGAATAAPVQSVAGRTGAVVLAAADIASGTLAAARLPLATGAAVGGVQVGTNLTVASGVISLTGGNVTAALGFTPGAGTVTKIETSGLATGGPITGGGTINVPAPAAGVVASNGAALSPATMGGGLEFVGSTLQSRMPVNAQSGNYTIVAGDRGRVVEFTGAAASTITLTAAATLGAGWWCILKHAGTGTTAAAKKLAISGVLDGVTDPAVYPGDTRIIQSDGTSLTSILLTGGFVELHLADSPFPLTLPPGHARHEFEVWAGGGGGGSGARFSGMAISAGSAGAGGAYNTLTLATAAIGSTSLTCTIAPGGLGGAMPGDFSFGNAGTAGGNSTVGTILAAYGGGAGVGGAVGATTGSGGGGASSAGANANTSGSTATGGAPHLTSINIGIFGGASGFSSGVAAPGGWGGGAGGGGTTTAAGNPGGSAVRGGSGGGAGGAVNGSGVAQDGGAGGGLTGSTGTGGAAGTVGVAGANGTAGPTAAGPGTAGGGGGGGSAGAAGNGGHGGIACGGGGGGAASNSNLSGVGGNGGAGMIRYGYGP